MIEPDLDDTHLCIRCSSTIVGLETYIEHRKHGCRNSNTTSVTTKITTTPGSSDSTHESTSTIIASTANNNIDHTYESFAFAEPEPPSTYVNKSEHGGKTSKSLSDPYDLPYELGADVFFSSLQLQSVQSTAAPSTSGKTGAVQQRPKLNQDHAEVAWIETSASTSGQHNTENLMKAVSDISEVKKPYESIFKPLSYVHESPDPSDEDEDEADVEIDEDEDEFDPIAAAHASGGKWKLATMRHSPPVVPETHTGGKWKPENRPNIRVTHTQLTRLSPHWEEQAEEMEVLDAGEHPPAGHTKGKWIPGTKVQRLEYKDEVQLKKSSNQDFWCNICCRKLKSKNIYENHLKTSYHIKRAEPEQQLEKAALGDIDKNFVLEEPKPVQSVSLKKRKRRANFVKCELCKHYMARQLLGKHLISHYHYRRMQLQPGKAFRLILDNIHSIVLQSPFQCRPCSFYANTEETFLQHWNSPEHLDASEGAGKFWCSFCHFECEDNNQMRRHLLGIEHKEVLLAINRSVPICISKKLSIDCHKCRQSFRYNLELRRHIEQCHPKAISATCTASDAYQSRFSCSLCTEVFRSQVSLKRHEKHCHFISKYFCSICNLEFDTPCKARRHRKTLAHRLRSASADKKTSLKSQLLVGTNKIGKKVVRASKECKQCDFVAASEVEAMLHELSHPKTEQPKTPEKLSETKARSNASNLHAHKLSLLKCKDCECICASLDELRAHRDALHPLLSHICMSCGQSFALAQALGRHSRTCQPTTSAAAAHGLKSESKEEANRKDNIDIDQPDTHWKCDECNFRASFESELIFHRLHHAQKPIGKNQFIACPLCSKSFRKHSLRCHLRQHTNEKIFACDLCDMKFSRRHNLKNHINTMHSEKAKKKAAKMMIKKAAEANKKPVANEKISFQCDTCGKVYRKKHALKVHIRTQCATEKRYACPSPGCLYAATSKSILKVHLAIHSQQSFSCDRKNCSYIGKSAIHLKRHSHSHNDPKKLFNCDKCPYRTKISGHLKRHLRSHTGEKPYKCPHCDFSCANLANLRKHVLKTNQHPGKFIYECNLCVRAQIKTETTTTTTTTTALIFRTNVHQELQTHLATAHTSQTK